MEKTKRLVIDGCYVFSKLLCVHRCMVCGKRLSQPQLAEGALNMFLGGPSLLNILEKSII